MYIVVFMAVLRERDGSKMGHFSTVRTLTLERKFYQVALLFFLCLYCGLPLWLSWLRIHPQCGRPEFSPWVGKIPWRRERLPTPVFWAGEFHGLYSPWGCKELDTTEQISLHLGYKLTTAPETSFTQVQIYVCFN